jgi:pimeloyl-ACP methyl ester carboxylesterase
MTQDVANIAKKFITPRRLTRDRRDSLPAPQYQHTLEIEGQPIRVLRWGNGPAILLVHGWEASMQDMTGFIAPLVAAGRSVIALDLPAHGESGGETATIPQMARVLTIVAEQFGPAEGIIAHSVGSAVSSLAVSRGLQVDSLVCIATPLKYQHHIDAVAAQYGLPDQMKDSIREVLDTLGTETAAVDYAVYGGKISARTLFLHSDTDKIIPTALGRAAAAAVPGAEYEEFPNLGHVRILSDPQVIARAVNHVCSASPAQDAD